MDKSRAGKIITLLLILALILPISIPLITATIQTQNQLESIQNQVIISKYNLAFNSANQGVVESSTVSKPPVVSRTGWGCPDGQSSPIWPPQYYTVTHVIIHHTATPNTDTDWAARVRQIWDYHTNTLGWGDIGYNYLIDPNGVIYEGRAGGDDVIAGHTSGHNVGTMGVAFLGTFSTVEPTSAALRSAESLIAWKCAQRGINPLGSGTDYAGTYYNYIAGHRDLAATECPGDKLYNLLPTMRQNVFNLISPIFSIGDTVQATANLNVRTGPGLSYPEITDPDYQGYAPTGSIGRIVDGPSAADGYTWWKVDYGKNEGSYEGWSVQDGLRKVTGEPVISSSLAITQSPPYYVGDTITAIFTITNKMDYPFTFDVITAGGRDPNGATSDFEWRQSITLNPGESYNYQGTLTLTKVGNYHFFCAYRDPDGSWNTAILTEGGVTNVLDISVNPTPTNWPPTAIIDSITPNPAVQGKDTVSFTGHGTDSDGSVVAYSWRSSIDGQLSTSPSFTKPASQLSVGTHTIYFMVQDNNGSWSTEVPAYLTINPAPQPALSYSPTSHNFGDRYEGQTDSTTFEIWNSGSGTLTYSLSESCSWVSVRPTSGSSTGEHDTITVEIDTTSLSVGSYICDIPISSNGGSGTLTVTVNVVPRPAYGVDLYCYDLDKNVSPGETATYTITVTNIGSNRDTVNLVCSSSTWTVSLDRTSVTLDSGGSTTVTLSVTAPSDAQNGDSTTITVTGTSQGDNSKSDSITATTTVKSSGSTPPWWILIPLYWDNSEKMSRFTLTGIVSAFAIGVAAIAGIAAYLIKHRGIGSGLAGIGSGPKKWEKT